MSSVSYSAAQRRAANQVWDAAETYDFEPLFLAVNSQEDRPDLYMNLIIGLAYKYYGKETIHSLFDQWNNDARQAMMDDMAWLYLENILFALERNERPSLIELRAEYAVNFFAGEYRLSRQEWMSKNHLVYNMQAARWSGVAGRKSPLLTPVEKKLYTALTPENKVDEEKLIETVLAIYRRFLIFDGKKKTKKPFKLHFTGNFAHILARIMPVRHVKTDRVLVMRSGQSETTHDGSEHNKSKSAIFLKREKNDRAYIENCFGRSLYPEIELERTEKELCIGNHEGCHIWITDGRAGTLSRLSAEDCYLKEQSEQQEKRNREYYFKNMDLYNRIINDLKWQIQNCILVHQRSDIMTGRSGILDTRKVWRAEYLNDDHIFYSDEDTPEPLFTVDILLDASASRLQYQELIATQGIIISESLMACHIPVRVSEFCSVRGYTVLRVLKSFDDRNCDAILKYFATGWNRDGLVMREAKKLLDYSPGPGGRHLLIFLTDAKPNDSMRILPSDEAPFGHDYGEETAVNDTAAEVRMLRRNDIRVSAVFMGEDDGVMNAEHIYGKEYVRIREIDQMAKAAGELLKKEIRGMNI